MKQLLLILASALLLSSCNIIGGGDRVDGNGNIATENRQANDFKDVSSFGPMDIILTQGSGYAVQVKGDENLLPYITTDVEGNTLKIKIKPGYNLHTEKNLEVHITAPEFNDISLGGSGNITSENTLTGKDKMNFDVSGSGNIDVKIDAPAVESRSSGSGDLSFSGKAAEAEMAIAGSGDIHCFGLSTEHTIITINGSGNADVYATKQLDVKVNGSGDVRYKGGASVDSHINGSGSASKAD